jgi:bifunctional non-homologous end joining protein LigD
VLDGEVVAFTPEGRPSFGLLQQRMHLASESEVRRRIATVPIAYLVFDVLWLDGRDLTGEPWTERRAVLESLDLGTDGPWQVPATHRGEGSSLLQATRSTGLEGVVAKKMDAVYEAGRRSRCWLKLKNVRRQEVVVGGWLPGEGTRTNRLGALLIGYYDDGALRFAGKVGTGFTSAELDRLGRRLADLARPTSPFADPVPWRGANYVDPVLVADVDFSEWTSGGTLRHPSYKGLRDDKEPGEVQREPDPGME